ncbi:MAG: tRNA (adenosine(37)-N6)-dimethylallyltransferase MiaA [Pseudohongiellaceae bacterium]
MGPTASGKTRVAVELVQQHPFEIISVDSAQIYRGMDIGTGKPDRATLEKAPHHLIDILDPAESYSAAAFRRDALVAMAEITARGRIPLLVGGTMLYFKALRDGLAAMPEADQSIREAILQLAANKGWNAVHQRLQEVDPDTAQRLLPTDTQRLQRALEVYEISGRPLSSFHQDPSSEAALPYSLAQLAIMPPQRAVLHQLIAARFGNMLSQGFIEEVKTLHRRGDLNPAMPAIRCVGYRQIWEYLEGHHDYDTMQAKALAATRQLAKRQLTWLRSWPDLTVMDSSDSRIVEKIVKTTQTACNY